MIKEKALKELLSPLWLFLRHVHTKHSEHLICHNWTLSIDWNVYSRRDVSPKPLLADCYTIINLLMWEKFPWKSWNKNFFFALVWQLWWLGVWAALELMELGVWSLEEGVNRQTRDLGLKKMCDRISYKDNFHSYIEVHSIVNSFSKGVWTLGSVSPRDA